MSKQHTIWLGDITISIGKATKKRLETGEVIEIPAPTVVFHNVTMIGDDEQAILNEHLDIQRSAVRRWMTKKEPKEWRIISVILLKNLGETAWPNGKY